MASLFKRWLRRERTSSPATVVDISEMTVPREINATDSVTPDGDPAMPERMSDGKVVGESTVAEPAVGRHAAGSALRGDTANEGIDAYPPAHEHHSDPHSQHTQHRQQESDVRAVQQQLFTASLDDASGSLHRQTQYVDGTVALKEERLHVRDSERLQYSAQRLDVSIPEMDVAHTPPIPSAIPATDVSARPSTRATTSQSFDKHRRSGRQKTRIRPEAERDDSSRVPTTADTLAIGDSAEATSETSSESAVSTITDIAGVSQLPWDLDGREKAQDHVRSLLDVEPSHVAHPAKPPRARERRRVTRPPALQPTEGGEHTASVTDDPVVLVLPGRPIKAKEMPNASTRLVLYGYGADGQVVVSPDEYACVGTLWCGHDQLWQLVRYEDREAAGDPINLIARFTLKDTSRIRVIEDIPTYTKDTESRTRRTRSARVAAKREI